MLTLDEGAGDCLDSQIEGGGPQPQKAINTFLLIADPFLLDTPIKLPITHDVSQQR